MPRHQSNHTSSHSTHKNKPRSILWKDRDQYRKISGRQQQQPWHGVGANKSDSELSRVLLYCCCRLQQTNERCVMAETAVGDNCIIILWTFGPMIATRLCAEWIFLDGCTQFPMKIREQMESEDAEAVGCYGLMSVLWNTIQKSSADVCQILSNQTTVRAEMAVKHGVNQSLPAGMSSLQSLVFFAATFGRASPK